MGGCSAASGVGVGVGVGGGREIEKITVDARLIVGSVGKGDGDDHADLRVSSSFVSGLRQTETVHVSIPAGRLSFWWRQ